MLITEQASAQVMAGDCKKIMEEWTDDCLDLVVTSPPYHLGKDYEQGNWRSFEAYLADMGEVVDLVVRKLRPGGAVCWQVGSHVRDGEVIPLDVHFYTMFHNRGLKLRNRIVWQFNFGQHARRRLSGRYETLLWFTKGNEYTFNLEAVRVPQLYPGKRHAGSKGEKAGRPSGNRDGKNPSDFWEFSGREHFRERSVWRLPNVKANHPEKTFHPCQFPVELAERCVLAFSQPGDLVADPFVGTGTTLVAAEAHGRRSWGIERDPRYVEIAQRRLDLLADGSLPVRPSGREVRQPQPGERVAAVPAEWLRAAE